MNKGRASDTAKPSRMTVPVWWERIYRLAAMLMRIDMRVICGVVVREGVLEHVWRSSGWDRRGSRSHLGIGCYAWCRVGNHRLARIHGGGRFVLRIQGLVALLSIRSTRLASLFSIFANKSSSGAVLTAWTGAITLNMINYYKTIKTN